MPSITKIKQNSAIHANIIFTAIKKKIWQKDYTPVHQTSHIQICNSKTMPPTLQELVQWNQTVYKIKQILSTFVNRNTHDEEPTQREFNVLVLSVISWRITNDEASDSLSLAEVSKLCSLQCSARERKGIQPVKCSTYPNGSHVEHVEENHGGKPLTQNLPGKQRLTVVC